MPFDVAFAIDPADVLAWAITFGELDGGKFDWQRFEFKEPGK